MERTFWKSPFPCQENTAQGGTSPLRGLPPPIVALRMHMVPARQAVTAQPACPHARWQWGLRSAQGPGCSVGCRGPEPRNEPFRTRLWVPGGSRPPRKLLSAHSLHAYTHLPPTIPHPRALSTFPSSLPPPPGQVLQASVPFTPALLLL